MRSTVATTFRRRSTLFAALALAAMPAYAQSPVQPQNRVLGTWRMVSATLRDGDRDSQPYGPRPSGMLVFTADMHFVEVLTDPRIARFASDRRGEGTDAENRRAMGGAIGFFGHYTVDREGRFTGNRVEGATFPNWVGSVRTNRELRLVVEGDRMIETFTRPGGGSLQAEYRRVGPAAPGPAVRKSARP